MASEVTFFEATNCVFNITDESNSFSITIPGYWTFRGTVGIIAEVQKFLGSESKNDFELNVEEIRKKEI